MRKSPVIWLIAAFALLLAACETVLPLNEQESGQLTINAIAEPGQPFCAYISRSQSVVTTPFFKIVGNGESDVIKQQIEDVNTYFNDSMAVKNARAVVTVNHSRQYPMAYNDSDHMYHSQYVPQVGDVVAVTVTADSLPAASAETTVLPIVELTDISHELFYSKAADDEARYFTSEDDWLAVDDDWGADTVMRITFKFHDQPGTRNYYMMRVRSVGEFSISGTTTFYHVGDVFTSASPVFHDGQLDKGYGLLNAYFNSAFDDHLIDGKDCVITVESRIRRKMSGFFLGCKRYVMVDLLSISPDLYYFQKSMAKYRISLSDVFTNPIGIHTNVSGGWGIVGSASSKRYIFPYANN